MTLSKVKQFSFGFYSDEKCCFTSENFVDPLRHTALFRPRQTPNFNL